MSYIRHGKQIKRRHTKTYLTPTEAIEKANTIASEADAKIAEAYAIRDLAITMARDLEIENKSLRNEIKHLKNEMGKAHKKLKKKKTPKRNNMGGYND